ncbi:MAG: TetR/AcrR family transcriptional regulator [Novosphingobium sp.]|nr:TetR/AcrR family transcriptional regulator [Novosphingobium sp.]
MDAPQQMKRLADSPHGTSRPASVRHANLSGQVMGTKGLATRKRLIAAMIRLLEAVPLREVTVKAVASAAGLSPATFYLYFRSVRECLHAAAGSVSQSTPAILEILERDWDAESGAANALALVMDHLELWEEHRTLLRVRNLAAEERDPLFMRQRRLAMDASVRAMTDLAERQQAKGDLDGAVSPVALASALFAMLDLVSAVIHVHDGKKPAAERERIAAAAYVLRAGLGCEGGAA